MSARPESWFPPAERARLALAVLLAVGAFVAAWGTIHYGFYARDQIVDTPVYERYGDAIARGEVPYRDFSLEYPPAALPAFALPSLVAAAGDLDAYERVFAALMASCGTLAAAIVAVALVRDGASDRRLGAGVALAAAFPVALGSVVLSRFDLWPALLTVAAVALVAFGRDRLGLAALGVAAAAKVYPAVVLPVALVDVWRRRGRRRALVALGVCVGAFAACVVPFAVLAPRGAWDSVVRQVTRPLQIESLGASALLVAHQLFGTGVTMRSGHGSQNLVGPGADAIGAAQTALQIVALLALWAWFARGPAERGRFLQASAACVCAFVAFGKVLSPQFLIWLVALVALVRGRRGLLAGALLVAALALTQLWFPYRYWELVLSFDPLASWLVFARDLVLVALVAVLAWPSARPAHPS